MSLYGQNVIEARLMTVTALLHKTWGIGWLIRTTLLCRNHTLFVVFILPLLAVAVFAASN